MRQVRTQLRRSRVVKRQKCQLPLGVPARQSCHLASAEVALAIENQYIAIGSVVGTRQRRWCATCRRCRNHDLDSRRKSDRRSPAHAPIGENGGVQTVKRFLLNGPSLIGSSRAAGRESLQARQPDRAGRLPLACNHWLTLAALCTTGDTETTAGKYVRRVSSLQVKGDNSVRADRPSIRPGADIRPLDTWKEVIVHPPLLCCTKETRRQDLAPLTAGMLFSCANTSDQRSAGRWSWSGSSICLSAPPSNVFGCRFGSHPL